MRGEPGTESPQSASDLGVGLSLSLSSGRPRPVLVPALARCAGI